jgi:hypothetical protein
MFLNKIIIFIILFSVTIYCESQVRDGSGGFSLSYSTNNVWGVDMFAGLGNNRFHLGYGHQFNGQENKVIKKQKETNELTEIGNGEYFWVIDLGYSRIFMDRITVHSEFSIGGKNEFTSFKNDRNYYKDYSLVTGSKSTLGIGLNVGYLLENGLEPFIEIHTLKKLDFGVRLSWQ